MLIFNGKKYFVPFIGKEKIEGADATPDQVVEGVKFAGANGIVEEGTMPTLTLLKPKIYVSSDGEITATVTQNVDGFVEKGEQSATEWLKTQDAVVIVPSNKTQTAVSKGWFTTGDVTVAPVPDKYKDATGANALPSQVVKGAYFLGADGVVEEGELPFYDGTDMNAGVYESDDEYAYIQSSVDKTSIIEDVVYSKVPLSKFGDVRPMWVAKGYTFTSEAGVLVDGECPIYIPSKVEPILCYSCTDTDPRFFLFTSETTTPLMIEDIIDFKVEKSEFGNATAENVRSGVRFTSAEGVNAEGRMPTLALLKPKIYVSPDGEITATVTQDFDGFVEKGEQSATESLNTKGAAVIVPSNKTQTAVSKGWFTTGDVTVAPIPDKYKDATGANALPSQVVKGAYFLGADGVVKEGTREDSCTLVFGVDDYGDLYVAYTKSDGTAHFDTLPPNVDTTIEGIMCGSVITMYSQQGSYFSPNGLPITKLGTLGSCDIYSAPTTSGTYRIPFERS